MDILNKIYSKEVRQIKVQSLKTIFKSYQLVREIITLNNEGADFKYDKVIL